MSYQIRQNSGVAIAHCQTQSTVDLRKEEQKIQVTDCFNKKKNSMSLKDEKINYIFELKLLFTACGQKLQ